MFSLVGNIEILDFRGEKTGQGIVQFEEEEAAIAAIDTYHDKWDGYLKAIVAYGTYDSEEQEEMQYEGRKRKERESEKCCSQ